MHTFEVLLTDKIIQQNKQNSCHTQDFNLLTYSTSVLALSFIRVIFK